MTEDGTSAASRVAGEDVAVGIFGGSGLYQLLPHPEIVKVSTPYGDPSAPLTVGELNGVRVAFLPRHGVRHELAPHRIPYRANLWALRSLGVTKVLAPFAAGSLQPHIGPGDLVVVDQFIDRTRAREDTFNDDFSESGPAHVPMADPYDAELRSLLIDAGREAGFKVFEEGTAVVIQGPRFSTRAESRWFRQMGWHVVNMTQYPEAALARELGMAYAGAALITDHDAGVEGADGVTQEEVFAVFDASLERLRTLLAVAVSALARS